MVLVDNLNLGSDESILKRDQKIIISGTRYEVVLTNRRLILAERETGNIRESIPYSDITLAVSSLNTIREPVLRLVINPPSGKQQSLEMIFVYQPGGLNVQELDASIVILKERKVTVQGTAHHDATNLMSRVNAVSSSLPMEDEAAIRPAAPEMTIMGTTRPTWQPVAKKGKQNRWYLYVIAAVVCLVVIFIAGSFIAGMGAQKQSPECRQNTPLTDKAGIPVATIIPVTTGIPFVSVPAATPTQEPVPANGTWVRISYAGNYTGNLKAGGWNNEVNTTGTSDYLLPVRDNLIEGSITKSE